jgi:hypothetical protein
MTLEEAQTILSEKRQHRGRPPREWSERKRQAEILIRKLSKPMMAVAISAPIVIAPIPKLETPSISQLTQAVAIDW